MAAISDNAPPGAENRIVPTIACHEKNTKPGKSSAKEGRTTLFMFIHTLLRLIKRPSKLQWR